MDDDLRWSAVVARDARADGLFVYCVKTTKIFCRPICKARLARRANVEFFNTTEQAQLAGYRACKRCQPLLVSYTPEADKIRKVCNMIRSLPENAPLPGLERLAQEANLTKHHFHRLFKRETGLTPREYAIANRGETGSESTESASMTPITPPTRDSQTPIIVGDETYSFEQDFFDEDKGLSTMDFNDFFVYYSTVETTYGVLLIAFKDRQICKLELGNSETELLQNLEISHPTLLFVHFPVDTASDDDKSQFQKQTNTVVEALEHPSGKLLDISLPLPIDMAGIVT